jgi:hypothetical protein
MNPRDSRGMVSFAVLMFAIVAMLILMANFKLASAVRFTTDGFDTFNSQTVEKNGLAQVVKESILALRETAITSSSGTVQSEIQNRLASLTFPAGVSVNLTTSPSTVPAHLFFPTAEPATETLPYFSTTRGLAGMGTLLSSFAVQGPITDLGRLTFTFARVDSANPTEAQTYTVNADLISVPLTNLDLVAYGLPATGTVPSAAPALAAGTLGLGVSEMVVSSNNPANDPTAYPDLYSGSSSENLPYQFRNAASFSWNAYEFVWSSAYQHALISSAQAESDPGNTAPSTGNPTPATGAAFDFSAAQNPTIAGLSVTGNTVTVDCSAVQSQIVAIIDAEGVGTVTLQGSAASGTPFVLLIRNTAGALGLTQVNFTGSNLRPIIFYLENSAASFVGRPQIAGALLLDRTSTVSGGVDWSGHVSCYAPASPLAGWNFTLSDSPAVKQALAALAPRVLLVSTSATR